MRGTSKLAAFAVGCSTLLVVAAVIGGSAAAKPTIAAANTVTYQDSTGENPVSPDIGKVVVSNDDAGLVSFAIQLPNRSTLGWNDYVWINMDTDQNATTGDPPLGFDYSVQVGEGQTELFRWDPQTLDWVIAPMTTLRRDWANSTLTVHVGASDLGATSAFTFGVDSASNYSDVSTYDWAPDRPPLWTYQVKLAPVLAVASLDVTPQPAMAGKPMTTKATVTVTRAGKPETLAPSATVEWRATTAGGVALKPASAQVGEGGVISATWTLAPTLVDTAIDVTVTVTQEGVTATKTLNVQMLHPAPALKITQIDCTPEPAVPGLALVGHAKVAVTRGGTAVALPATAKVRWTAMVGPTTLKSLASKFTPAGVLTSTWKLPKVLNTKVVQVRLTVTMENVTVTKTHLHRIR